MREWETPEAHRGSSESGGGYASDLSRDGAARAAEQARIDEALRRQAEEVARRRERLKPHTAREAFKKAPEQKALARSERVEDDRRPHCMPQPKRGKTRGPGGKSKGFVPFCERK